LKLKIVTKQSCIGFAFTLKWFCDVGVTVFAEHVGKHMFR